MNLDKQEMMTLTDAADLARKLRRRNVGPHAEYWAERLERACGELLLGRETVDVTEPVLTEARGQG